MTTRVTLLGATGSVGRSTVDVLGQHPDRFSVEAVVGGSDAAALAATARAVGARCAAVARDDSYAALKAALAGTGIEALGGAAGVLEAARRDCDITVAAIVGTAGLAPTHAAIAPGRRIALANKECLVTAGRAFMRAVTEGGAHVVSLDSEHDAIVQALGDASIDDVERITLTASGGPFRTWDAERIASARVGDALTHPNYSMGAKITIDSASLMNKGLELIEAHHLFGIEPERLSVLVHPQQAVHGLVYFRDGSVTSGMAAPDMRVPISHGLGWPGRLGTQTRRLDLVALSPLHFEPPDEVRFPALRLAREALSRGGAWPTVLNAANEVAVEAFLRERIAFDGIPRLVEATCEAVMKHGLPEPDSIPAALEIDAEARVVAASLLLRMGATVT